MPKVVFLSNYSKMRTGFGRHMRTALTELTKRGYEMIEFACGKKWNDPELKGLPWKAYGTIPENEQDYQHLLGDPGQRELFFFGNYSIDKLIKEEKPDAIILMEDIWKISWAFYKPWFNRIPTLIHTPIDSSPVLPMIVDNKDILKNIWVKTDFAVRDLAKIGIESKAVPLLTDQSCFYPLPTQERENLRRVFNIQDSFVIGFVFRNQLRKLVVSLMREFKAFKDKYPESKAKLLLHTNFDEGQMGWNIPMSAARIGIDKEDILCTYLCKNCRGVQVLPYMGQNNITCGRCGTKDALKNPSIDLGITDEELNAIYNVMDFYCHPATSGGFEGPMSESALAGLPSATCDYSFGETFVRQGESLPIKYTIVDELGSHFHKSQPLEGAITEVMEEVYLNRDKYRKIGLENRAWALEKFDLQKGIEEYAKWIDSAAEYNKSHSFDYDFYDLKNVDYPVNYLIEDNSEFIIDTYSGIFGVKLTDKNGDIQKYCQDIILKGREVVVRDLKAMANQLNEQQKPVTIKDFLKPIDENRKRMALICRGGAIECFNILPFIKPLKQKYPNFDLYICAKPEHSVIFDHLDGDEAIANFVPYHPMMEDIRSLEGRRGWEGMFDLAFVLPEHQYHNGII